MPPLSGREEVQGVAESTHLIANDTRLPVPAGTFLVGGADEGHPLAEGLCPSDGRVDGVAWLNG